MCQTGPSVVQRRSFEGVAVVLMGTPGKVDGQGDEAAGSRRLGCRCVSALLDSFVQLIRPSVRFVRPPRGGGGGRTNLDLDRRADRTRTKPGRTKVLSGDEPGEPRTNPGRSDSSRVRPMKFVRIRTRTVP